MPSIDQTVRVYQDLANLYVQQGQAQMRDRFLVLAAEAMYSAGRVDEAERIRARLLQVNPHHLFKPFSSLSEAMESADVKNYLEGLRRTYPPEKAAHLLESLQSGKGETSPAHRPSGEQARPTKAGGIPETPVEPIKVFRIKEDEEPPMTPVLPDKPSRPLPRVAARDRPQITPEAPVRPATPIPAARPVNTAQVSSAPPLWPEANPPSPWQLRTPEPDRAEAAAGAWLATSLFWVLLAATLALAVYALGGPFLPL
jgi:hypothetical protein